MSQLISFMIEEDQIAALKRASLAEGVDFLVEAQRIFDRGLQATSSIIDEQVEVSALASQADESAVVDARVHENAKRFRDIVASDAFGKRFSAAIAKRQG